MENYLFGSARVRALENNLIGKEKLERLLAASGIDRCVALLAEFGVAVVRGENGAFLREETLLGRLRAAYEEVGTTAENAEFARLFRWQYDCNNIKAAIKCFKRGVDPEEIRCDGGASANGFLMQFQADVLGIPVNRLTEKESTALGAVYLCGVGTGVIKAEDIAYYRKTEQIFLPNREEKYIKYYKEWKNAVNKCVCK